MAADAVIGRLVYLITGDTKALDKDLSRAQKQVRAAGQAMQRVGTQMTKFVTLPILGIGTAFVKAASDAEETAAKFGTAFRDVKDEATASAEALAEGYGLSRTESQRLLAATGDLLKGFGATGAQALGLSDQVQKLAVDLASYNNLQGGASRASEILTKAMLGEREALTSLGIKISETEVQQRLVARGQQNLTGRVLLLAKAQATLDLALEQSGDALGDFARTQDSAANQMRILKARVSDLATIIGADLLPVATELIGWARSVVERFAALDEEQRRTIIRIAAIAAAIGPLLIIGGKLTKTISTLSTVFKIGAGAMGGYALAATAIVVATAGLVAWNNRLREARRSQDELLESTRRLVTVTNDLRKAEAEAQVKIMTTALADQNQILERNRRGLAGARAEVERLEKQMATTAPGAARQLAGSLGAARERVAMFEQKVSDTATRVHELDAGLRENQKAIDAYTQANIEAAGATGELTGEQRDLREEGELLVDMLRRQRELEAELAEEAARNSARRFEFGLMQLDESAQQIVRINLEKQEFIAAGIARVDAERWAQGEIARIREQADAQERQRQYDQTLQQLSGAQQLVGQMGAIFSQMSTNRSIELESEYETRKAYIEKNIKDEDERAEAIRLLDIEFGDRRRELAREEAIRNKAIAVIDSIINTAVGVTKALSQARLGLAAAIGVLGGIQTALIMAQPIPKAAAGADFVTRGPQLLQVGDNPGGIERVRVTPESSPNMRGAEDMFHFQFVFDGRMFADFVTQATKSRRILIDAGAVT